MPHPRIGRLHLARLAPALVVAACSSAGPAGSPAPGTTSASSSAPSAPQTTPGALASGAATGAPGSGACVPSAPSTFASAICVCDDLAEAGVLRTHASTAGGAASVGVDGRVGAATGSTIEGSLLAYRGLAVAGDLAVRDGVSSTSDVDGAGALHVGGDLSVGGTFGFAGDLEVGGALRLAHTAAIVPGTSSAATAPYVAPSTPCACDPASLLPIATIVSDAATSNDNAARGLGTTGADFVGVNALSLSAGRYYFKDVVRVGAGSIAVHGAVAIFIDGSIDEVGDSAITIDPGASLDLYVSGIVATAGRVVLGDPAHPEAFRMFIGGAGSVMASAGAQSWNGLVYAPQAHVAFAGGTEARGAIFAKSLDWAGVLDVTYDGLAGGSTTTCTPAPSTPPSSPPPSSPAPPTPH